MTTIRTSCSGLFAIALSLLAITTLQAGDLLDFSTRALVGTGDRVLIGGFTITGTASKTLIIRALGPSIKGLDSDTLADPILQLFKTYSSGLSYGQPFQSSDDWRNAQELELEATMFAPTNDFEAAAIVRLRPGTYTAVVSGYAHSSGMALFDVHELGTSDSRLTQMSSRGDVQTGDAVLIGGFTVADSDTRILLRAIGPMLRKKYIINTLLDPTLELRDANGLLLEANDDWKSDNEQAIRETGLAPFDDRESAILRMVPPGNYTAIVRGKDNKTGIALVEVYRLPSFGIGPLN